MQGILNYHLSSISDYFNRRIYVFSHLDCSWRNLYSTFIDVVMHPVKALPKLPSSRDLLRNDLLPGRHMSNVQHIIF